MHDGSALWVAGFGRGELGRIDLATGTSTTVFAEGGTLRHIVGDESRGVLYISDMRGHCIWVLDLKTQAMRKLAPTDANPNTIALSPDGQILFVSCRGPNGPEGYEGPSPEPGTLIAIDAQSGQQLDGVVAGEQPTALALSPDGKWLFHSDLHNNRVEEFAVPDTAALRAGHGGRTASYRRDLRPIAAPRP
jgi:sugar lactone lactonase YvrE